MVKNAIGYLSLILLAVTLCSGCSLFGGTDISPSAKMAQKVAQTLKEQEDIRQEFKDIKGDVSVTKTDLKEFKTEINTKIEQNSIHNNESLKSLAWTAAGIWFIYEFLKFLRICLVAYFTPGLGIADFVKGMKK